MMSPFAQTTPLATVDARTLTNTLRACVGALQRQVATRAGGAGDEPERDDWHRLADVLAGVAHELEALCPHESKRIAS